MSQMSDKLAFTIAELASVAGVGRSFIYQEIKDGRLLVHKAGRRTLAMREDVDRWLAAMPKGGSSAQH